MENQYDDLLWILGHAFDSLKGRDEFIWKHLDAANKTLPEDEQFSFCLAKLSRTLEKQSVGKRKFNYFCSTTLVFSYSPQNREAGKSSVESCNPDKTYLKGTNFCGN